MLSTNNGVLGSKAGIGDPRLAGDRQPEVQREMQRLEKQAAHLLESLARLEHRLKPILRQEPESAQKGANPAARTPLGNSLLLACDQLETATDMVNRLTELAEV